MRRRAIACRILTLIAVALGLPACGGGMEELPPTYRVDTAESTPTLLDDEGQPMPSSVRPSDAGAWTSNGRYATPRQAQMLAASLGDSLVQVSTACCGEEAVDRAAGMVWALQAASDQPASQFRVLVRGSDERLAAATVNRLLQGGLREVWLVTVQRR